MKNFILIIILFAGTSFIVSGQEPWQRLSGFPQENDLHSVAASPDGQTLLATGDGATIMRSDDKGATWQLQLHPDNLPCSFSGQKICFTTSTTVFIAGAMESILKSTDGGLTWQTVYSGNPSNSASILPDIGFCDTIHGFAVGQNGQIIVTNDGGISWTKTQSTAGFDLQNIAFADNLNGLITGGSTTHMLRTTDGGASWQLANLPQALQGQCISHLTFNSPTDGFMAGSFNETTTLVKTTDSGTTWQIVSETWPSHYRGQFAFGNNGEGYFVMASLQYVTRTLVTTDNGETWTPHEPANLTDRSFHACCLTGASSLLVVGQSGSMCQSVDGSNTFSFSSQNCFGGMVLDMQFTDDQTGYLTHNLDEGGVAQTVLKKTIDGGHSWVRVDDFYFYKGAFHFLCNDTGWVAPYTDDNLYKTTDGGSTWTPQPMLPGINSTAIKFFNNLHGIVAGEGKAIITNDGGASWTQAAPSLFAHYTIRDIEYQSPLEIWAVGNCSDNKAILKSNDGGTTWQEIMLQTFTGAADLFFATESKAFLASNNAIFRSDDGGETWHQAALNTPSPVNLSKITFTDDSTGYAVGYGEYQNMLKTTDGGNNWNPITTNQTTPLTSIYFADKLHGLIAGDKGLLMKTETGGMVGIKPIANNPSSGTLKIFPIPAARQVTLCFGQVLDKKPGILEIVRSDGSVIFRKAVPTQTSTFILQTQFWLSGIYYCRLSTPSGHTISGTFIKE